MRMSDPGELALFLGLGGTLASLLLGPIGQAVAHRLRGGKAPAALEGPTTGEVTADRVAMLEERLAELEAERVQLEERLDFAERMLTRGSAEQPVPGPGSPP